MLKTLIQQAWKEEPSNRPSAEEILKALTVRENELGSVQKGRWLDKWLEKESGIDIVVMPLKKHQGTVAEIAGEISTHIWIENRNVLPEDLRTDVEKSRQVYDGTNACQFISCAVADYFLDWKPLLKNEESLICSIEELFISVPEKVNTLRDINNFSDIDKALHILAATDDLKRQYLVEELLKEAKVIASKDDLRKSLHKGITSMAIKNVSVAVYTLQSVSFVIHTGRNDQEMRLVLTDSHCIPNSLGGHDAGIVILIKYTIKHQDEAIEELVEWIIKQMTVVLVTTVSLN